MIILLDIECIDFSCIFDCLVFIFLRIVPVSRGIVCRSQENSSTTKAKQYLLSERRQSTNLFGVETSSFYSMLKLENYN